MTDEKKKQLKPISEEINEIETTRWDDIINLATRAMKHFDKMDMSLGELRVSANDETTLNRLMDSVLAKRERYNGIRRRREAAKRRREQKRIKTAFEKAETHDEKGKKAKPGAAASDNKV